MSSPAPQIDGATTKSYPCTSITGGESMSGKINIHNLFHTLHPFWIHHTYNCILLSNNMHMNKWQWTNVQSFKSLTSHKGREVGISYFTLATPLGSTIPQRKIFKSSCPENNLIKIRPSIRSPVFYMSRGRSSSTRHIENWGADGRSNFN
jgi:hypothetical protein